MNPQRKRMVKPIVTAFSVALLVAALGGITTDIGPWYYALSKPSWQPPDWLFGPVWTLIFGLAAVSGVLAWRRASTQSQRLRILVAFAFNILCNTLWSLLFFKMHRPDWALIEVVALWGSIVVLMVVLWPFSRAASSLMIPYLAWVSFASYLNEVIVRLNPPFA